MAKSEFENLQVYQLAEDLADRIWNVVIPMIEMGTKAVHHSVL